MCYKGLFGLLERNFNYIQHTGIDFIAYYFGHEMRDTHTCIYIVCDSMLQWLDLIVSKLFFRCSTRNMRKPRMQSLQLSHQLLGADHFFFVASLYFSAWQASPLHEVVFLQHSWTLGSELVSSHVPLLCSPETRQGILIWISIENVQNFSIVWSLVFLSDASVVPNLSVIWIKKYYIK